MERSLKYISISHHTAKLSQRESFHLTKIQQFQWFGLLRKNFRDITSLMILATCNRTEIYWESEETSAIEVRDFFIQNNSSVVSQEQAATFFRYSNSTNESLRHLLRVANGLDSSVTGDAQIIGQIKEAWMHSNELNMRGSLLERAMQAVFKTHKRVVNETDFHQGTQSTAYKALKLISDEFGRRELTTKKLLIIGAGEISNQLLKYLPKFAFQQVFISNRTEEKAVSLARKNELNVFPWNEVEANQFDNFDAVISAVSNRKKLITKLSQSGTQKVLIDLAMPANIAPALANEENISLFTLDQISSLIDKNEFARQEALQLVEEIIAEEQNEFSDWLKNRKVRNFLKAYKQNTQQILVECLNNADFGQQLGAEELKKLINRISDKLVKDPAVAMFSAQSDKLTAQNLDCIIQVFATQKDQYEKDRGVSC
ncbi:glutamyl-tRNA reductase [Mangrovibacterium diazotrophicum]|uniref:Glutamyl-tRNA reductase n=1 Tax=Mangrovibacterium diazotrophicum TaxID=1261403 RepID=A0A419VWJ9_9BACT|nr:glutamyl-tRNA reductase [Mangrovibacterium diazotrophicum]RKD86537.1 glutamyl-tRNA reductase [Mangrovibacterium diazotrophicum]